MRADYLTPLVVDLTPGVLQPGVLYVSPKFKAAVHLCCCGCGEKVVTPLSPAEWQIRLKEGKATIHPSIGNWSMACKSHYVIRESRVIWAGSISKEKMRSVFERDQRALNTLHREQAQAKAGSRPPRVVAPKISALCSVWNWLTGRR